MFFTVENGTERYYEAHLPEMITHTVIIVHGYAEYIGRYHGYIAYLNAHNVAVYGFDARGHGDSPGIRAHVDAWEDYTSDLNDFVRLVKNEQKCKPIMFAHSMGTTIATNYLIAYKDNITGLILSGTTIRPVGAATPLTIFMAKFLSTFFPKYSLNLNLKDSATCSDKKVVEEERHDPKMFKTATLKWGSEILKAIEKTKSHLDIYTMPLLMIHGKLDSINEFDAAYDFYRAIQSDTKQFIAYAHSYHELLNDVEKKKVFEDTLRFIRHLD